MGCKWGISGPGTTGMPSAIPPFTAGGPCDVAMPGAWGSVQDDSAAEKQQGMLSAYEDGNVGRKDVSCRHAADCVMLGGVSPTQSHSD